MTPPIRRIHRGFSLVELLMALAVISMLAAVAIFNLTNVMDAGKDAAATRNAHQFCHLYAAAKASGVQFFSNGAAGILDELTEGKRGRGGFSTTEFRLPLDESEKQAVLKRCDYDALTGTVLLKRN
jgi:prepilin-type N-terminal cleavage/methylation domain-containing protein